MAMETILFSFNVLPQPGVICVAKQVMNKTEDA